MWHRVSRPAGNAADRRTLTAVLMGAALVAGGCSESTGPDPSELAQKALVRGSVQTDVGDSDEVGGGGVPSRVEPTVSAFVGVGAFLRRPCAVCEMTVW